MSNYPPPHHQNHEIKDMIEVIKAYALATVISIKDNKGRKKYQHKS